MPKMTAFIESAMQQRHIPGAALAILRGTDVLYEGYHGLANLEHNASVLPDTMWEIASITKPFTAQAILLLADANRLNLDAPLAAYVPDLPHAWRKITPRHCLAHQSGIPSYTDAINYWEHFEEYFHDFRPCAKYELGNEWGLIVCATVVPSC